MICAALLILGIVGGAAWSYLHWYNPPYSKDIIVHNWLCEQGIHASFNCPACNNYGVKQK